MGQFTALLDQTTYLCQLHTFFTKEPHIYCKNVLELLMLLSHIMEENTSSFLLVTFLFTTMRI